MRALVLGGGGSKGAFTVGAIQTLRDAGIQWDLVTGCSTGALIAPFVALDHIDALVSLYSTVRNADIYTPRQAIELVVHRSLYDSAPLWRLINAHMTPDVYQDLMQGPLATYLLTTHMQSGQPVYWTSHPLVRPLAGRDVRYAADHLTFTRAMLASASQPILFPLIEIADDHQQYCDGGVVEVVPLKLPLDLGADILDVIVLTPERAGPEPHVYTTFLDTMIRTLEVLIESATVADIAHAQFINEAVRAWRTTGTVPDGGRLAGKRVVQLNLIRPHTSLTTNALRFDPSEMQGMMALGRIAGAISVAQQDATP